MSRYRRGGPNMCNVLAHTQAHLTRVEQVKKVTTQSSRKMHFTRISAQRRFLLPHAKLQRRCAPSPSHAHYARWEGTLNECVKL